MELKCDRCLREVTKRNLAVHASVVAVSPDVANAEEQDEESGFLEGYQLNVDSLISNEIILRWPMKILSSGRGLQRTLRLRGKI